MKKWYKLLFLTIIGILPFYLTFVQVKAAPQEGAAFSFALDFSGSMKKNDEERLTVEILNMFMDTLSPEDYISVTAYNDGIIFESELISVGDEDAVNNLKSVLGQLPYSGDTDNGLGMKSATEKLLDERVIDKKKYVIIVTDGDTDLPAGSTRTLEDSNKDLSDSARLAVENGIIIDAVEYTEGYMRDTSTLSVVTSSTKGGTILVDNPSQYVEVMLNILFSKYRDGSFDFEVICSEESIYKREFQFASTSQYMYDGVIFAIEPISEVEIMRESGIEDGEIGNHYVLLQSTEGVDEKISVLFGVPSNTAYVVGTVKSELPVVEIMETEESTEPVETAPKFTKPPIMAVPVDMDIEEDNGYLIYLIVAVIAVLTIGTCVFIIRKLLFPPKELPGIQGILEARFIDLKSKNETKDIRWNLSEYPPEGVTLKELFYSVGMKEDLQDLDKVCFYPSEKAGQLIFVHCMEGGVFKGEQLIRKNVSIPLKEGDILYFSFSENSSELAIEYGNP